jgi:coproporphyrinogen III oxidase-like Fe-S oxidoreductase
VIVETLISRYVRHLNQRLMNFESSPGEVQLPEPDPDKQYLLYLHIPFCVVLCPFCSFHRVEFREDKATQYFQALQEEIRQVSEMGYKFGEVYVGGGTPTVLPDLLAETLELISSLHPVTSVSVETNPHDLDEKNTVRLKQAGVNRLSVGVQSFDDRLLREMNRYEKY